MSKAAAIPEPDAAPQPSALRRGYRKHMFAINVSALIGLFILVVGWQWVVFTVPAGFVAVKYYRFAGGTDVQEIYGEGAHLKLPWDKVAAYPARLQEETRNVEVLTRDGLAVTLTIACRFRLLAPAVGWLHRHIGPGYLETLIGPSLGSYAHLIASRNTTEELYSERLHAIQEEIKRAVAADLAQRTEPKEPAQFAGQPALHVDDVLILGIRFSPAVHAAIDRKMEQYHLREEYQYRLQREELESRRKEIEARGIAEFQKIVGAGISENYLRWKSIDAQLALAQSPNTKIIVMGNGKEGSPIFLNGDDGRPVQPAPNAADAARLRAETPLTGPVAVRPEGPSRADDEGQPSWLRRTIRRIGALLTVPPRAPRKEAERAGAMIEP